MHENFFGLKEKAFNLTPDPDFLYFNQRTKAAFGEILYGIERREGFAAIIGDAGTGKTTLSCALLERIEPQKNVHTVLIQNPTLAETDILRCILHDLSMAPERISGEDDEQEAEWTKGLTKKELIDRLNTFLVERARQNAFTVLIIDEAQDLSLEMLENLRLLSNLETTKKKLLQIIFFGQLEFEQKLLRLTQLNQRISFHFKSRPLSRSDTENYIRHRLSIAGANHKVQFGRGALDSIYMHSKGYPRLINVICDRSLREAYGERSLTVTKQMVRRAVAHVAGKDDMPRGHRWTRGAAALAMAAVATVFLFLASKSTIAFRPRAQVDANQELKLENPGQTSDDSPIRRMPDTPVITENEESGNYALQIYSFRGMDAAEQAASQLNRLHYTSFIVHYPGESDEGWYGVYAGPFGDVQTAMRISGDLRAATGASPVLRANVRF